MINPSPNFVQKKPVTLQLVSLHMELSPNGLLFIQSHEGFGKLVRDKVSPPATDKSGKAIKAPAGKIVKPHPKWHRVNPYNDSKGYATTGYGHLLHKSPVTAADIEKYQNMTEDDGLVLLKQDLQSRVAAINKLVKVSLTQYQFDAIVCFTFNVGEGSRTKGTGLAGSKFLEQLNKGIYNGELMMNFRHPPEIIGRRRDEVTLFTTGTYSHAKSNK
ncbi:MAG: lysozyme [Bacteroidota bacterium]